jgi:hypothetical protein
MMNRIRGCAKMGLRNTSMCGVPIEFRDIVRQRLEAVGFKVKDHTGRDAEDFYTDITW